MSPLAETPQPSEEDSPHIFNAATEAFIIYDLKGGWVLEANAAAYEMYGYSHNEFIGINSATFMEPESYVLFREYLHTMQPTQVLELLAIHKCKNGERLHVEMRASHIHYHGKACLLSAIRNVSRRIQIEKAINQQLEARRREQATLLAISQTLASTLELQPSLILEQLREIIPYTYGVLFTLEDAKLVSLAVKSNPHLKEPRLFQVPIPSPETLTVLFNGQRPLRIANIWGEDDPSAQFLRQLLGSNEAITLIDGMNAWMWVPLAVRGRIIGCIGLAQLSPSYFTELHADLALSVAHQAAITIINSELYGQAQALAVLEERQRLARNLHDAVNQSLFSAGLIAEALPLLWESDQAEARRSLEDLRRLTRAAQAEMRALLAELRPSTLTESDLGDLLHLLANALSGRVTFPVTVNVSGEVNLPAEVQITFYRVCQEALNNVVKHAKASKVEIELNKTETLIELHIRDNGRGFDFSQNFSGHYGLSMMRERAEAVGALFSVMSELGQGTELILSWTLPIPVGAEITIPAKNRDATNLMKTLDPDPLVKRADDLI